jgi:hypothetical protein
MSTAGVVAPVPPTVEDPLFANYPVRYTYRTGEVFVISAESWPEVDRALRPYRQLALAGDVSAVHLAPDGQPVIEPAGTADFTEALCGSTRWVIDTDHTVRKAMSLMRALSGTGSPILTSEDDNVISGSQHRWFHGDTDEIEGLDGFRVACETPSAGHDPSGCSFMDWSWDAVAGVPR